VMEDNPNEEESGTPSIRESLVDAISGFTDEQKKNYDDQVKELRDNPGLVAELLVFTGITYGIQLHNMINMVQQCTATMNGLVDIERARMNLFKPGERMNAQS